LGKNDDLPGRTPVVAVAVSTAATTPTAAASTSVAAAPVLAFLGFIHPQRATVKLEIVERGNSFICGCVLHLDETKASKTPGVAVSDPPNRRNGAVLLEQFADLIFGYTPRQITNVQ